MEELETLKKVTEVKGQLNLDYSTILLYVAVLLVAILNPLISLFKNIKKTGADASKSDAESTLYDQLQKQIIQNTQSIEMLYLEKSEWHKKALELEVEVNNLRHYKEMMTSMKERLDKKDAIIEEQLGTIRSLNATIIEMKDRMHSLEMRMLREEHARCIECPMSRIYKGGLDVSTDN